jgi:hypothetical protein
MNTNLERAWTCKRRLPLAKHSKGEAMRKPWIFAGLLTGILLSCSLSAFAQEKEMPATALTPPDVRFTTVHPQGEKPPPGATTMSFVSSEFAFDGKPIKGSPYSAEAVTETTQILGDGNRIVNRSTASLYRDSEGRTRREQTLKSIGGVAAGAQPLQTIMISDPVAGVSYSLDPGTRTARKSSMGSFTFQRATTAPAGSGGATFVYNSSGSETSIARSGGGSGGAVTVLPSTAAPSISWTAQSGGGGGYQVITRDGRSGSANKEDLGTQTIEGVPATGTRVTHTIPADQIGNERPIEIVDERWFSKDLQAFVMTKHSDPRSGETVYRLTNISRTEPDHSLFQVPADYQVKEGSPASLRTRKPE